MILDNEDILLDSAKETYNNPFLILSEYLRDFDTEGFMEVDKALIKRVLSQLNFPVLYNYKFEFEFKTDCIKLNLLNSNNKFVGTALFIKKYFHWSTKDVHLYFNIFVDFGGRLCGEEGIIIRNFLRRILVKYNFDISNRLIFKQ